MTHSSASPEEKARQLIDSQLQDAGWEQLESADSQSTGFVEEYPIENGGGTVDRADFPRKSL